MMNRLSLRVAVANGSLGKSLIARLQRIGCHLEEKPRRDGYIGTGFGCTFWMRDRRMIPWLVSEGNFDAGITGEDLLIDSGMGNLRLLMRLDDPVTRWVLACQPSFVTYTDKPVIFGTELPHFADVVMRDRGPRTRRFVRIEGHEECAIADGLCDAIIVVTETGNSLKEQHLIVYGGYSNLFESAPVLFSKADREPSDALRALATALNAR